MIRAPFGNKKYWDEKQSLYIESINNAKETFKKPSKNPNYRPQYSWSFTEYYLKLILTSYSLGDNISELSQHFNGLLDAWELSNRLADELKAALEPNQGFDLRHLAIIAISDDPRAHNDPRSWVFSLSNLEHYNWCFWLVGLALLLEIEDELWHRLLKLIGGEGEDQLLDKIIASRQSNRRIGDVILHKKPYARLLKAIEAPKEKQAQLLFEFVDNWYKELKRKENEELWWYMANVPMEKILEMGNYFGYWCIEAAVAVKVFDLDDSLCLKHPHYPKAFLHEEAEEENGVFSKITNFFK